jgi:hypothetical protein
MGPGSALAVLACPGRRNLFSIRISNSRYTFAFSRHDLPEVCVSLSLNQEGAGNAGCTLHPRSRAQICAKNTHTSIQVQRRRSDIPCAMALRLMTRSPRGVGLSCPRRLRIAGSSAPGRADLPSADLTPTAEASGPHDFTVRFSIARQHALGSLTGRKTRPAVPIARTMPPRPPHPIPTFGNDGQRPFLRNRMAGVVKVICPTSKGEFCPSGYFVAATAGAWVG